MARIDADTLLKAYSIGVFPMAASRDDPRLYWFDPDMRGIIPLDGFHVPKRLARTVRSGRFEIRVNSAFDEVMAACAEPRPDSAETWINAEIRRLYGELHARGHAHSVECWREGRLAGGLYGVSLGAAFFGESMFSRETDASKVALVHLVERLKARGFVLLDAQFLTPHLARFGAIEVPRAGYKAVLASAVATPASFA